MKTKILTLLFALVSVVAMGQKKVVWEELALSVSTRWVVSDFRGELSAIGREDVCHCWKRQHRAG